MPTDALFRWQHTIRHFSEWKIFLIKQKYYVLHERKLNGFRKLFNFIAKFMWTIADRTSIQLDNNKKKKNGGQMINRSIITLKCINFHCFSSRFFFIKKYLACFSLNDRKRKLVDENRKSFVFLFFFCLKSSHACSKCVKPMDYEKHRCMVFNP